jgi:hypothetical protein
MVDQQKIERRAKALMEDGLGVLQAWNQACRETGALDEPDPLDKENVVRLIRAMDVQGTVLLTEDLRQAG